jgi:dTMP kinase
MYMDANSDSHTGLLFTFEGGEGAGKGTQIKLLIELLKQKNIPYAQFREPGGTSFAEVIRKNIFSHKKAEGLDAYTERLAFQTCRSDIHHRLIKPALTEGKIVILDRCWHSTYAHQGHGAKLYAELKDIEEQNKKILTRAGTHITHTIYLDIDPEEGLTRIAQNRIDEITSFDELGLAYHTRVREGYLDLVKQFPTQITRIDANPPCESLDESKQLVHSQIVATLGKYLPNLK